jgi:hypothetical protein
MISFGLSWRMSVSIWVRHASSEKEERENSAVEASRTQTPNVGSEDEVGVSSYSTEKP